MNILRCSSNLGFTGPIGPTGPSGYQIAFSAYDQNIVRLYNASTEAVDLSFPFVTCNKGNGYDASTNTFTAPVDGNYFFNASCAVTWISNNVQRFGASLNIVPLSNPFLTVSDIYISSGGTAIGSEKTRTFQISSCFPLLAGEQVKAQFVYTSSPSDPVIAIHASAGGTVEIGMFTGFLL